MPKLKNDLMVPLAIVLAGVIIAGAVVLTSEQKQANNKEVKKLAAEVSDESSPNNSEASQEEKFKAVMDKIVIDKNSHIRGNPSAPITLVEYSDMQCPFCNRFHPTVKKLLETYPDKIRWVYKHFPLDSIHPQATPAAEASECIAEQKGNDGFWKFVDGVFENQSRIGPQLFEELASQIGVDMTKFKDCVSSRKYKDKVREDYREGISLGVRGTPGSFINGRSIPGAMPFEYVDSIVQQLLSGK
jgi:protein-disulfide isomerase